MFSDVKGTSVKSDIDLGVCACDLTSRACDINCCCDEECASTDKLLFSECETNTLSRETKSYLCSYTEVQNVGFSTTENIIINPNVFCIWRDRNDARNYYTIPSLVKTASQYEEYADSVGYSYKFTSTSSGDSDKAYKYGEPLITHLRDQPQLKGVLPMPVASGLSSQCLDTSPVKFLVDKQTSCFRNLKQKLEYSCDNETSLNAERFINRLNNTVSFEKFIQYVVIKPPVQCIPFFRLK